MKSYYNSNVYDLYQSGMAVADLGIKSLDLLEMALGGCEDDPKALADIYAKDCDELVDGYDELSENEKLFQQWIAEREIQIFKKFGYDETADRISKLLEDAKK